MELRYFKRVVSDIAERSTGNPDAGVSVVCTMIDGEQYRGRPRLIEQVVSDVLVALESGGQLTYIDLDKVISVSLQ